MTMTQSKFSKTSTNKLSKLIDFSINFILNQLALNGFLLEYANQSEKDQ